MNFIKRGLLSLWAKKGRTLLLCAVFSAILIFDKLQVQVSHLAK